MEYEDTLPGVHVQPTASQPDQDEFTPILELATELPAHLRAEAYVPVSLETTGVTPQYQQPELISKRLVLKESIIAKLLSIGACDMAEPLQKCHTQQSWAQCQGCRKARTFWNRCENYYCPNCQPALAKEREDSIRWWAEQIEQPKHVVITVRNAKRIEFAYYKWLKKCITKLRRRAFARNWLGGLWQIETTNESRGWHVHVHMLVDAKWIDQQQLCREWADIVGQDFAICWVRDARGKDYLRELCKYTVKPTEMAKWPAIEIAHYINATQGQRMFGVFGTLYGRRTKWREFLDALCASKRTCECGCQNFRIYSDSEWKWKLETEGATHAARSIPPPDPQLQLIAPRAEPSFPRD